MVSDGMRPSYSGLNKRNTDETLSFPASLHGIASTAILSHCVWASSEKDGNNYRFPFPLLRSAAPHITRPIKPVTSTVLNDIEHHCFSIRSYPPILNQPRCRPGGSRQEAWNAR